MNIVIALGTLNRGGTARVVSNLSNFFVKHKHQVILITTYDEEPLYYIDRDIKHFHIKSKTDHPFSQIRRLKEIGSMIKSWEADIVVAMGTEMSLRMLMIRHRINIPVVISFRANPERELSSVLYRMLANILYRKTDGVICQTEEVLKLINNKWGKKNIVLVNPVGEEFLEYPFQTEKEKTIIAVGRLVGEKNYPLLIKTFAKIANEYPDYRLIIVGDGDERYKIVNMIADLQIQDQTILYQEIKDIKPLISKCGIFVLSSDSEGMPNALMEAMALGAPCIATDCPVGGPGHLIKQGYNGILIPVGSEKKLEMAIRRLINDRSSALSIGEHAKDNLKNYSIDKIGVKWEIYLESCLSEKFQI